MKTFRAVDLFCGCGGFSYGMQSAGFEIVAGADNDEVALQTFQKNHNNSRTYSSDLAQPESVVEIARDIKSADVIIAGPPCQGFSLTGPRKEHDKRNKLFYSVFDLAERIQPSVVIIENVPGIATLYQGKARSAILDEFSRLDYQVEEKLLYAPDYGIPQIRRRMFFVGVRQGLSPFAFPPVVCKPEEYVTCEQAISDLPSLERDEPLLNSTYLSPPSSEYQEKMRADTPGLKNHEVTVHTQHVKDVISLVPEGGNYKDLPPGVGESRRFNEAWTRYHSQKPSKTIDTGHRNHFHYKWNRVPTVRENARLQSFPDCFIFYGTKTQQYKHVGNAVPPLWGYHMGLAVRKVLEGNEKKKV